MAPLIYGIRGQGFPRPESAPLSHPKDLDDGRARPVTLQTTEYEDCQKAQYDDTKDHDNHNNYTTGTKCQVKEKVRQSFTDSLLQLFIKLNVLNSTPVTKTVNGTSPIFQNISTACFTFYDSVKRFNQRFSAYFEDLKVKSEATMTEQLCKLFGDGLSTGILIASSLLNYGLFVISGSLLTSASTFARHCALYFQTLRHSAYFASQINRLASYVTWKHVGKPSALSMAAAGFYCTASHRDEVSCFTCGLTLSSWSRKMVPISTHARLSRGHCKYINDSVTSGNVPIGNLSEPGRPSIVITPRQCAIGGTHPPPGEPAGILMAQPSPDSQFIKPSHLSENDQHDNQYVTFFASLPERIRNGIAKFPGEFVFSEAPSVDANALQEDLVRIEAFRLRTFNAVWQYAAIVQPTDLAREGFFYTGAADRVQCAFCKGVLRNWERGDKPDELHAQNFTYCRFVQGHDVGNVPIFLSALRTKELSSSRDSANIAELGIVLLSPKYPEFAIETRRLLTFKTWPSNSALSPEILAKAGFFYTGVDDEVSCFFCGVRVRDWKKKTDAWIEHAAKSPTCQYVIQAKGSEFVTQQTTIRGEAEAAAAVTFAVDPREIRARMDSPMARCVLDMNYPADLIKEVLQKRLATVGRDFETSEDLLAETFRYHDEKQASTRNDPSRVNANDLVQPTIVRGPNERPDSGTNSSLAVAAAAASMDGEGLYAVPPQPLPTSAESPRTRHKQRLSPQEENRQLKAQLTCKICMEEEIAIILLPCGHVVACPICSPALEKCPMCRVDIRGTARLNFSA